MSHTRLTSRKELEYTQLSKTKSEPRVFKAKVFNVMNNGELQHENAEKSEYNPNYLTQRHDDVPDKRTVPFLIGESSKGRTQIVHDMTSGIDGGYDEPPVKQMSADYNESYVQNKTISSKIIILIVLFSLFVLACVVVLVYFLIKWVNDDDEDDEDEDE